MDGWVEAFLMWGDWDYINVSRNGHMGGSIYIYTYIAEMGTWEGAYICGYMGGSVYILHMGGSVYIPIYNIGSEYMR